MIGQINTIARVKDLIRLDTKLIILTGQKGMGKATLLRQILKTNMIQVEDTKINTIRDILMEVKNSNNIMHIIIDGDDISESSQSALLKMAEDTENARIYLTARGTSYVLQTLLSRGVVVEMIPYTQVELRDILHTMEFQKEYEEQILQIAKTPRDLKNLSAYDMEEFNKLIDSLVTKLGNVSYPNALKAANAIVRYEPTLVLKAVLTDTRTSLPQVISTVRAISKLEMPHICVDIVLADWIKEVYNKWR